MKRTDSSRAAGTLALALAALATPLCSQANGVFPSRQTAQDVPRGTSEPKDLAPALPFPIFNDHSVLPPPALDTVVGPYINLDFVPFSPLAVSDDGSLLAAVNPHADLLRVFDVSAADPADWELSSSFRTAWGPSSCAFWNDPDCGPAILVTCTGSDALLAYATDGRLLGCVDLPAEPSDLLVDPVRDVAWVSCMAVDCVAEVDLLEMRVSCEYRIPSKHPAFLAFENGTDGAVLAAPMLSGNGTLVERGKPIFEASTSPIVGHDDLLIGLPDEDLFRLGPGCGQVEPVAARVGTVLFGHGRNPHTGQYWMLATDARNAELQTEGEARGVFSANTLSIFVGPFPQGDAPVLPDATVDLDDSDRSTPLVTDYDPDRSVGQPYSLAFDPAGNAYVTGMLTWNVTMLDPQGDWLAEWDVGAIPRGLQTLRKGTSDLVLVHCWGASRVEVYDPSVGTDPLATLSLGEDPALPEVRQGREIWYRADDSLHRNVSCNTCHVDGFSDLLAWDLSDVRAELFGGPGVPLDPKGPLVTQTVRNLAEQAPLHWRGERASLLDFNGAFASLLGGDELDPLELAALEAFVLSLRERANPYEAESRLVSNKAVIEHFQPGTSATDGMLLFEDFPSLNGQSCASCHALPTGTFNDHTRDEPDASQASNSHFVVAALVSLWRKFQPVRVLVRYSDKVYDVRAVLGAGPSAPGLSTDVQDFIERAPFVLPPQGGDHIAAFLLQLDTGLAPLVHRCVRIGFGASCGTAPFAVSAGSSLQTELGLDFETGTGIDPDLTEFFENRDAVQKLFARATPDDLDLTFVGMYEATDAEGAYDHSAEELVLLDGSGLELARLSVSEVVTAMRLRDLEGFLFSLPRGMGEEFGLYDPWSGGPPVVAGPVGGVSMASSLDADGPGASEPAPAAPTGIALPAEEAPTSGQLPHSPPGGAPVILEPEVVFATVRVAKIVFRTDVRATGAVECSTSGDPPVTVTERRPTKEHMLVLSGLEPGRTWDLRITAQNVAGTGALLLPAAFETAPPIQGDHVAVTELAFQAPVQDSLGVLRATLQLEATRLDGAPAVGYAPVVDVLARDPVSDAWTIDQEGASLFPLTDATGRTDAELFVAGLSAGMEVHVFVRDVAPPSGVDYVWSLPSTAPEHRSGHLTYSGAGP